MNISRYMVPRRTIYLDKGLTMSFVLEEAVEMAA